MMYVGQVTLIIESHTQMPGSIGEIKNIPNRNKKVATMSHIADVRFSMQQNESREIHVDNGADLRRYRVPNFFFIY